jgi:catechol 2,3-dioxygenase-like lactoylglutathione lyase family enzyme
MAKIRHIAIVTEDQAKLVEFYKRVFSLNEVHRHSTNDGKEAIYLSDGYINLAILPAHGQREGIHHFGFQVESIEETARSAMDLGAARGPEGVPRDGRFAEVFILDPATTRVDLSEAGWKA